MPYTYKKYPNTMKNLAPATRNKAIDILNKLKKEKKMDSANAIPTAIEKAKEWAGKHDKAISKTEANTLNKEEKHVSL